MKKIMKMKWASDRKRLLAMEKPASAKINDIEMNKRYTSPLALTKWLYNALKGARCPVP
jgi:hypothetical protein